MHRKNVIVGVIYRPPNRDINTFNDKLGRIMDQIKSENKLCYLLGDYNINLLNCEKHDPTGQFFDVITSNGFLPIITRPTRVTATSATLIENIFTNNILDVSTSFQGLFVTDLSDHYPIFHIDRQMKVKESEMFMYKRIFSPSNRDLFCRSLSETDWCEIYRTSDTQKAFDIFHNHFMALYNRCFPRTRVRKPGCLRLWKILLGIKTNCIKSIKRLNLPLMKILIKHTRANCRTWWKWLKRSIIRICLPDTKATWKNLGMSWNLL